MGIGTRIYTIGYKSVGREQGAGSREQGAGSTGSREQGAQGQRGRGAEGQRGRGATTTNYPLPITHYPLLITHYQQPLPKIVCTLK
ncbi:hypothetical protein [Chroococcidiopsis sp.]|uniref:hypothetical protein n=1 Tax=Chroococcidiopsis sp. TaxID=3088168 RepID=UPI003F667D08